MNNKILQKVIEELKKKEPSIPYVLGMLETLAEMGNPPVVITSQWDAKAFTNNPVGTLTTASAVIPDDESKILEAQTKAKLSDVINSIKYE